MKSTWSRILKHTEHAPVELDASWAPLDELAREGHPTTAMEVGGIRLFGVTEVDESESWPEGWVPLQPVDDYATLVLFEGAVWLGRREGQPELDAEPLFADLDSFLEVVATILEVAEWEVDGDAKWLSPSSEDRLWKELPDASKVFDLFQLPTIEARRRFLMGEMRTGAVVVLLGSFFLLCTLAFLTAPFGTFVVRAIFTAVVGCVPLALTVYGSRAVRRGRAGLARLTKDAP